MKQLFVLSLFILFNCSVGYSQYKRFSVGIVGTANNFDSHKFYSTPGVSFQYNFKRIFSLSTSISQEKMKRSSLTFNDLNSTNSFGELALTYLNIPFSCRASFGKKNLIYLETGLTFHLNKNIHNEGYIKDDASSPDILEYYSSDYSPESQTDLLFFAGAGIVVPITKGISLQVSASKNFFYQPESTNDNHIFINETFLYTRGFIDFKYSLGVIYNFNSKKNSKYQFKTYSLNLQRE